MTKQTPPIDANQLRESAEQMLAVQSASETQSQVDDKRLLHELQVHQIELEMLNENLHQAHRELEQSWTRYYDLYELAPVGYLSLNEQDLIVNANRTARNLLGLTKTSLLEHPLSRFIVVEDREVYYAHRTQLVKTNKPQLLELRILNRDGQAHWLRVEMNRTLDNDATPIIRVVLSDINEQKNNDDYLRQAAAMFEATREGVMITDAKTKILVVNRRFSELTGYSVQDVIGKTPRILSSGRQDEQFYAAMWDKVKTKNYWQGEIWNRRKDGEIYPQMLSISAIRSEHDLISHYVGVFSDITKLKDAEARLDFLAHHDPLTGLANRLLLFSRLEHCIGLSRRERKSAALLMMDLDRFKDVNDSFGHLAGDELLQQVAHRLTSRLRNIDTVTRLGGDEFALLLEDLSHPQDAALVALEIIKSLSTPWQLSNGIEVRISVSIGISLFPEHGKSSEELLQHADTALYRAKGEGRGNFKYFSEDMTQAALRRINLESLLRRAVIKDELMVYYQPQVDIRSGRIIGAEALLRWHNAEEGMIPPDQFIPVAEEIGLISEIGEWVLRQVCQQGVRWIAAGLPPLKLAVNLSLHQFRHGDIATLVAEVLHETGFPAEMLELELTESALMERESEVVLILQRLQDLGVRLAIDDFGTGYSSFAYLKHFPLNILKIDKTFIEDLAALDDDKEIAAAIIGLGHTLHLQLIAEGVETEEQLQFLREQGCDFYQGYYKSPAIPAPDFVKLLPSTTPSN